MHRVTGATWGAVAVGLFAVFLVAGLVFGSIPISHSAPGASASPATPSKAATPATPSIAPARTYQTLITVGFTGPVAYYNPVPTNLTFYTNITFGAISSSTTKVWVNVTGPGIDADMVSGVNFTLNASAVSVFNNNGILYSNYTWSVPLNAANLGCMLTSCGDKIAGANYYDAQVSINENGASFGGGFASTTQTDYVILVSTWTTAYITSIAAETNVAVPATVTFWTNTSWGATTNATTWIELWTYSENNGSYYQVASWVGGVNSTNVTNDTSSVVTFSGYIGAIYYSNATWTMLLNQTTLGCTTATCNTTLGQGDWNELYVEVDQNGTSVGGSGWTGWFNAYSNWYYLGTTLASGGETNYPNEYQALPFLGTGWLNVSYAPSLAASNSTYTGYIDVFNTETDVLLVNLSANHAINTTNSDGFSLIPTWAGTIDGPGVSYVNFTWSLNLSTSNLGADVPYAPLYVLLNLTINGTSAGGVNTTISPGETVVGLYGYVTFTATPTTAAVAFTPLLPGYVPVWEPLSQNFTLTVQNAAINATTTTILATIIDETVTAETGVLDAVSYTYVTVVDNQTQYTFPINTIVMTCSTAVCVALSQLGLAPSPTDVYALNITAEVDGVGSPTNGTIAYAYYQSSFFAIFAPVSAVLSAPNPGANISPGNVTVSVTWAGSFVATVVLDIYSPTGALVFSQSFSSASGLNATWVVTSPGTYTATIIVGTAYEAPQYFNATLTVNKEQRIYVNSTSYENSTLIPGLSAAAAGTLLLVVGLLIGMVVAFLLGRAVWGGRQNPQSPQPWESATAGGAAGGAAAGSTAAGGGTNVCPVCGKSFATPEELHAHEKSEHGME